jgi:hypothetical protein
VRPSLLLDYSAGWVRCCPPNQEAAAPSAGAPSAWALPLLGHSLCLGTPGAICSLCLSSSLSVSSARCGAVLALMHTTLVLLGDLRVWVSYVSCVCGSHTLLSLSVVYLESQLHGGVMWRKKKRKMMILMATMSSTWIATAIARFLHHLIQAICQFFSL